MLEKIVQRAQHQLPIGAKGSEFDCDPMLLGIGNRASEIAAELAMHFEQSHDWPRALEYILQAAENAAARSAHHEAIDLANRGLEALKLLPEAPEHKSKK